MADLKVLITGITGFAGSHLADYALAQGASVCGWKRWNSRCRNIRHLQNKVHFMNCDITDAHSVYSALKFYKPDWIFHLAAQSFVSESWDKPHLYFQTNVHGTINLLDACRELEINPRIHIAGTGEEYGYVYPEECPITENSNRLRPMNPYAVSKVAQTLLGQVYHKSYGQDIVCTRAFNHIGPRRDKVFAFAFFAYHAARIEQGKEKAVIPIGRLDAKRDYTHVKDMVRAYWLALEKGESGGLYCISSGDNHVVREGLDKILNLCTYKDIRLIEDPKYIRPTTVPLLHASADRFCGETGWEPTVSFEDTIEDIMEYWRERVEKETE